ncbi:hypothetical protein F3Y22_tig00112888pilonHSYRG00174 [Hibiscus syriacus]|uniref:Cyclin-dependent kinases regulatory subunit n=1 Tax=Hibiscus syriacus TaxID=106335 RepID=A0A6A2Y263_HIBSY|nr:hypothetical protein F3Y22_tig00112888pilonHSYRG00174 [Hibiscus syriacus]
MGQIQYSEKYFDDIYEYRHVFFLLKWSNFSQRIASFLKMSGVQSEYAESWMGSLCYSSSRTTIMLFRRPLNYQQQQENLALAK